MKLKIMKSAKFKILAISKNNFIWYSSWVKQTGNYFNWSMMKLVSASCPQHLLPKTLNLVFVIFS